MTRVMIPATGPAPGRVQDTAGLEPLVLALQSLNAVQVMTRLKDELGFEIDFNDLVFQTLGQIAAACEERAGGPAEVNGSCRDESASTRGYRGRLEKPHREDESLNDCESPAQLGELRSRRGGVRSGCHREAPPLQVESYHDVEVVHPDSAEGKERLVDRLLGTEDDHFEDGARVGLPFRGMKYEALGVRRKRARRLGIEAERWDLGRAGRDRSDQARAVRDRSYVSWRPNRGSFGAHRDRSRRHTKARESFPRARPAASEFLRPLDHSALDSPGLIGVNGRLTISCPNRQSGPGGKELPECGPYRVHRSVESRAVGVGIRVRGSLREAFIDRGSPC